MAERRMFALTITDSDAFLDMSLSAQALYFHLCMRADDDGFLNNPKKIQRMVGASDGDLQELVRKRFLISFPSGVVVIKHWFMHNYIRKDRYKETVYTEEKGQLDVKENGSYTEGGRFGDDMDTVKNQSGNHLATTWQPNDNHLEPQVRLGKVRLGKDRLENTSCPEVSQKAETIETAAPQKADIFIELPAIGTPSQPKKSHKVTIDELKQYQSIYPAVDVEQELRQMALWLDANPSRKKSNTKAFIINWLKKSQDRSSTLSQQPRQSDAPRVADSVLRPNSSRPPAPTDGPVVKQFQL